MDFGALTELITRVERRFPVNIASVDGAHLWPLVRIQLIAAKKYDRRDVGSGGFSCLLGAITAYMRAKLPNSKSARAREAARQAESPALAQIAALPRRKYLFLCLEKEHHQKVSGQPFAPVLDSILTVDSRLAAESLKISTGWKGDLAPLISTNIIDPAPFTKIANLDPLQAPTTFRTLLTCARACIWLAVLGGVLRLAGSEFPINVRRVLEVLTNLRGQRRYFDTVLASVQPAAVFLTSYTGRVGFVRSARARGIAVVDVQHGGMHFVHPLAAHWTSVPEGGYLYLPNFFWTWDAKSAAIINDTSRPAKNRPLGVAVGNPWLAVCSRERHILSASSRKYLDEVSLDRKKKVLVALQYGTGGDIPDYVAKLAKETQHEWRWIFRLHPMGRDRKSTLSEQLGDCLDEQAVNAASEIPLHFLLRSIDFVVTPYSTIANEALLYGAKTIFVDPQAQAMFAQGIDNGSFAYAPCEASLAQALRSDDTSRPTKRASPPGELATAKLLALIDHGAPSRKAFEDQRADANATSG